MSEKDRKASLERLINQYEQAKLDGDKTLAKNIKAIIDRIKNSDKRSR
jgi:hypothetical protein